MEITYLGERIAWGIVGNIFVILAFISALFSAVAYIAAESNPLSNWKKLARAGFNVHAFSVLGIIGVMFYLLLNHAFEFHYVWQHSNTEMPMQYILSCFWEGQEGSFLLWTFWHMVLGFIVIRSAGKWEAPVLAIIMLVQIFLSSMLLGIYIGGAKLGSNPFLLLREHPDFMNLPFLRQANYLENLDGRGLNPLLQNYWMTIHPPTLFLGFASTLIPFAYATAGLWRKQAHEWIKPALPWTYFSIGILGTGILMGGAWAYESLSFGGFWAWDPVENASLVPWLTIVAGGHVMLINRNKGKSLTTAFFLIYISFILILYSTFLTRSGILGDSSVHAFTDLGMSGQLLVYLFFFTWLPAVFSFKNPTYRNAFIAAGILLFGLSVIIGFMKIITVLFIVVSVLVMLRNVSKLQTDKQDEEEASSREFWMFVGALVLLIAAFQIIFTTSTPVINKFLAGNIAGFFETLNGWMPNSLFRKLADAKMAAPTDEIAHYNAWQLPFAIITGFLIAIAQFLKYGKTDIGLFIRKIAPSFIVSFLATLGISLLIELEQPLFILLLLAGLFATLANADYFFRIVKGKISKGGANIAHVGFGLLLVGALISTGKKEFISQNQTAFDLGKDFPNKENILLARNDVQPMGDYLVSYRGDSTSGINIYYKVDYYANNNGSAGEKQFTLYPFIQTNPRMGNVAEPSTKHFLHKDIFTHVTYANVKDPNKPDEEWKEAENYKMQIGDTIFTSNSLVILDGIQRDVQPGVYAYQNGDLPVGANLRIMHVDSRQNNVTPLYVIRGNSSFSVDTTLESSGLNFSFIKIDPENEEFHIRIREKTSNAGDFIILKAIIFPGINILWIGCILMAIGTAVAVVARIRIQKKSRAIS
jgi:cytochrome c-type biogenesis protein CcmF